MESVTGFSSWRGMIPATHRGSTKGGELHSRIYRCAPQIPRSRRPEEAKGRDLGTVIPNHLQLSGLKERRVLTSHSSVQGSGGRHSLRWDEWNVRSNKWIKTRITSYTLSRAIRYTCDIRYDRRDQRAECGQRNLAHVAPKKQKICIKRRN